MLILQSSLFLQYFVLYHITTITEILVGNCKVVVKHNKFIKRYFNNLDFHKHALFLIYKASYMVKKMITLTTCLLELIKCDQFRIVEKQVLLDLTNCIKVF